MNSTDARRRLPAGIGGLAAVLFFAPIYLFGDDLPDRIATHYDASGTPNQSMTLGQFTITTGLFLVIGVGILTILAFASRRLPAPAIVTVAFLGGFFAGMGAGIMGSEVLAQRGNARWEDAASPLWGVAWSVFLALAVGAIAARLSRGLPSDERQRSELASTPILPLGENEHAVWTGEISSPLIMMLGLAFLLAGAFLVSWSTRPLGVILMISALPILALAHVRLQAGMNGLTIRYGPIGLPRQHIALDRILQASAIEVRPSVWGGWGYRGSLVLMKQAALVLHGGPGLRLDLTGGKTFVVAVDRPEIAASVLNGERRRGSGPTAQC